MNEKKEEQFQSSKICWICEKLIDDDDEKVRDHCHVTGKFRGAAHCICNVNLQLTKKVPVIFHNLRSYDSHLIFNELNKFEVLILMSTWTALKDFFPDKECFYSSAKDGTTGDNGKKVDVHISDEDYLTCNKIWN